MDAVRAFIAKYEQPTILSDIDGTIAFYEQAETGALNARFGTQFVVTDSQRPWQNNLLTTEERTWKDAWRKRPQHVANIAPDTIAIHVLQRLHSAGFRIVVASNRDVEVAAATRHWLDRWDVPADEVHLNGYGSKLAYAQAHQNVIWFDDQAQNAVSLPTLRNVQLWLPRKPWTPTWVDRVSGTWVFDSWMDVLQRLNVTE